MADEGIEINLPIMVIDHVANTDRNLGFIRNKVNRGVQEGDGLTMFKARKVRVQAEEEGWTIFRTELMVIVKCEISDAHHAIYRDLNQTTATKLRIGVYTFDTRGCKYPDRTMSSLPIDVQQIHEWLKVNRSILNPIYPSTPDRPSGPFLEEKVRKTSTTRVAEPTQMRLRTNRPQVSSIQAVSVVLSTPERSSEPSLEERNQNVSHLAASNIPRNIQVRNSNDDQVPRQPVLLSEGSNRRIIITDEFNQSSVFERLGTRHARDAVSSKSKPPNYSRISSTLKLFQPTALPSSQQPQPTSSYASAVKRNLNINLSTAPRPTTKSMSDIQHLWLGHKSWPSQRYHLNSCL